MSRSSGISRNGVYYLLAALALAAVVACYLGVTLAAGQEYVMRTSERENTQRLLAEKSQLIGERLLASEKIALDSIATKNPAMLLDGAALPQIVDLFFTLDTNCTVLYPRPARRDNSTVQDFQSFIPSDNADIRAAEQAETASRDYAGAASIYGAAAQNQSFSPETRAALALRAAQCLVKAGHPVDEDVSGYFRQAVELADEAPRSDATAYLAACAALEWARTEEKWGNIQSAEEIAADLYNRLFIERTLSLPAATADYLEEQLDALVNQLISKSGGDLAARYGAARRAKAKTDAMAVQVAEIQDIISAALQSWRIRGEPLPGEVVSFHTRRNGAPLLLVMRAEPEQAGGVRITGFRVNIPKIDVEGVPPGMSLCDESGPLMADAAGRGEWAAVAFDGYVPGWRLTAAEPAELRGRIARGRGLTLSITLICVAALALCGLLLVRAMRMQARLDRTRTKFISNVSHELVTPAASIRLISETLASGKITGDAKQKEYFDMLHAQAERLSALLENLLEFSRGRTEAAQYSMKRGDLAEAVRSVVEEFVRRYADENLRVPLDAPLTPVMRGFDEKAIRTAVRNLLDNAYKYSDAPRDIRVSVAAENDAALIRVTDNGIGIAPSDLEKVFDRFYRCADDRVRSVAGSGIGLSLVREIARAHGGDVEARSEPGRGSAFTITLPL